MAAWIATCTVPDSAVGCVFCDRFGRNLGNFRRRAGLLCDQRYVHGFAHRDIGEWATRRLAAMTEKPQLELSPARDDLLAAIERARQAPSNRSLPSELLREFMAVGDAASCRSAVDQLLDAGADRVVLVPNPAGRRSTAAMVEQMRAAATLTTALREPRDS